MTTEETGSDEGSVNERAARSQSGRITHVTGRGSDSSRGLPPVHTIALRHDDGTELTFGPIIDERAQNVHVQVLGAPSFHNFGICPICESTENLTREHVPQRDLGGHVMTLTCHRCNNGLGAKVEPTLRDWFDDAIGSVRFSGGDIPGRRRAPRILLRTTPGRRDRHDP